MKRFYYAECGAVAVGWGGFQRIDVFFFDGWWAAGQALAAVPSAAQALPMSGVAPMCGTTVWETATMKCPVDGATLVMTERSGVEIDYCPQCRGVWLDRGELDKIVERSAGAAGGGVGVGGGAARTPERYDDDDRRYSGGYKKKRRESWLDDLFDF